MEDYEGNARLKFLSAAEINLSHKLRLVPSKFLKILHSTKLNIN